MEKQTAIKLLGGTPKLAAQAMQITTQAISMWPDVLPIRVSDRVRGASIRLKEEAEKAKSPATPAQAATDSVATGA